MTKWIPTIAWTFVVVLAVGCAPEDWDPTAGSTYAATACTAIPCHDGCLAAGHLGGDCRGTSCLCYDEDPTVPSRDDGITPDGESCYNGVDDNGDLLVDCADPACCNTRECFGSEECGGCVPTLEECSGELDEDCDGLVDCLDPNCAPDPACDPGCQDELQTCHVGHCNGYIGEMIDEWTEVAECMTHNDGGCSDDELYAWCSRYWDTGVGLEWPCTCAACRRGYREFLGRDTLTAADLKNPGILYKYLQFRNGIITAHLLNFRRLIKHSGLEYSIAARADYFGSALVEGQDWMSWGRQGLVDFICPMNYKLDRKEHREILGLQLQILDGAVPVYSGIGRKWSGGEITAEEMIRQAEDALDLGAAGISIFHFNALREADFSALKEFAKRL